MNARIPKRVAASTLSPLVVRIRGYKAIRDADLAALLGVSLTVFYKRIAGKLWRLKPRGFFKLSERRHRGRLDGRPVLAFTHAGVLMVAGIFADHVSLEIGMDIAHVLKNPRRASAHKKRPSRRVDDPDKASRYYEARARLQQQRLFELLNKKPKKKLTH